MSEKSAMYKFLVKEPGRSHGREMPAGPAKAMVEAAFAAKGPREQVFVVWEGREFKVEQP